MKRRVALVICLVVLGLPAGSQVSALIAEPGPAPVPAQEPRTLPDVIVLAKESKLGPVTFNHAKHATTNRNISGTGPIACVECHHTAQPAAEVAKHPPLKTSWPADRTTSLSLELLAKGTDAIGLIACRSCHARAGTQPTNFPEIPTLKHEDSAAILTLTNQLAFHRNCANCHEEVAKHRQDVKAPGPQKCTQCHKK
jgi:cytochrome c553